ncbi:S100 calcium binding protein W [Brienomyrus brachyistius]|uniref:S100 calcium binding protein W n=1 Tax=Brienomyrus brachyistius TaxID=42636 RepID=UPI0020B2661E|nr:S100 calcium binding protein W [Brienomyrus brachyistius]
MSTLEKAVISLVELFQHYARMEPSYRQLSWAEFKELLQINFREFCMFVGILAKGYYPMKTGRSLEIPRQTEK